MTAKQSWATAGLLLSLGAAASAQTNAALPSAPTPTATVASTAATPAYTIGGGTTGGGYPVQVSSQSSLFNPLLGSVQARRATSEVLVLPFDDALKLGIENNLALVYAKQTELGNRAQRLQAFNVLLPNIDLSGSTAFHQFNLAAQGFRPGSIAQFAAALPPGSLSGSFPTVVKVDVTQGQFTYSQYLFDWAGFDLIHAVGHLVKSSERTSASTRGQVVQAVGIDYLRIIAAQSQVAFDQSLLSTDANILYQTTQEHQAGTVANLDELRARVQYQTQQQSLISDQNTLAKAKIALNRSIGLAPEQEVRVSEAAPFANLEAMPPEEAEAEALRSRQDYQSALEQVEATQWERKAATRERYPSLVFNANYGVQGVSGGVYHDVFQAIGTLQIPIFQEARFRADRDTAEFQLQNARAQLANTREQIRQDVRGSLIDLTNATATVAVARSNADLARTALEQATERFRAGVENNLPSVTAESTLQQAQVQLVNATFQYNQAKLNFARNLGLIDVDFHREWQGGRPAGVMSDRAAAGR